VSASPSSTGKDRPGRPAGSGSSPSNGLSSARSGKSRSSEADSTASSATEPDEGRPEFPAATDGTADDNNDDATLGTPKPGDGQTKDSGLPWTTSSEPAGSAFADATKSTGMPFGVGASSQTSPAPPDSSAGRASSGGSAAGTFRDRVNEVIRPGKATAGGKSPRKAHLQVSRLEPWSVMKFSFVMSLVCFIVLLVAVTVIYMILAGLGVFDQIVQTINELTQDKSSAKPSSFDAASWFSFTRIFGYTLLVGALNVLLITALATVWSVIYNIAADFVGGIEVTLKEAE
jgi:Transmembrane domain of unknown function (DUF3566)